MQALWADGWFYISSAGLLVSGSLFFFLLGQYRAAAEAVDGRESSEPELESPAAPVRRVFIPEEPAPAAKVASVPAEKAEEKAASAPAAAPLPTPATVPATASRESTTPGGGVSPAVVYLQNITSNLNELHGEIRDLTKRVNAIASRDEALIERLGELSSTVEELKGRLAAGTGSDASAPAGSVAAEPAPKRARKPAPAPEAAPAAEPAAAPAERSVEKTRPTFEINELAGLVAPAEPKPEQPAVEAKPEPAAEAKPEAVAESKPARAPDATIRIEPPAADAAPEDKPRRGPVWPV